MQKSGDVIRTGFAPRQSVDPEARTESNSCPWGDLAVATKDCVTRPIAYKARGGSSWPRQEREFMKLYMHPVSITSRPVRLFAQENGIELEEQLVDLMTGEHTQAPFSAVNPNKMVPVLVDDDLTLTESSAILKYLAEKIGSPAYPQDLKKRAKINEAMDWFNSNLYRDYGYGLNYPQLFPHHKRPSDEAQQATLAWAQEKSRGWLQQLNDTMLGNNKYLCGDTLSIADYFGVCLLTLGELTRCDFRKYPNVMRWLATMKELRSWGPVNEALYGYAEAIKDTPFKTI